LETTARADRLIGNPPLAWIGFVGQVRRVVLSRSTAWILLAVLAVGGFIVDLLVASVNQWFRGHQFVTAMLAEGILLGAVYVGFEYLASQAEARRWRTASAAPMRLIAATAERMDGKIESLISYDRSGLDRCSPGYGEAKAAYDDFKSLVDRYQALLTASPYMVEFLPICLDLERYTGFLLPERRTPKSDDRLCIAWYDGAVWEFIAKIMESRTDP